MSALASMVTAPSGLGLFLLASDSTTGQPSMVTNVVDNNERQKFIISGQPVGGTFALIFGGNTTAPIPTIPSPPYRYFQWNYTAASAGTFALSVNITGVGTASPNQLYEIIDGTTIIGTATLNLPNNPLLGPANPTPFPDPDGTLTFGGSVVQRYPLGTFAFTSTDIHVRVSCPGTPTVEGYIDLAYHATIYCDCLWFATAGGATVSRLDTGGGVAVSPGQTPTRNSDSWQVAAETSQSFEFDCVGPAGVRYLVDPAVVQSALQALASVGTGNLTATGDGSEINPIVLNFVGTLGGAAQALITASDPAVTVSEIAQGGILPSIVINGGSPIPVPYAWIHYYATSAAMPGISILFPQWPAAATYSSVKHGDNTTAGSWTEGPATGYTANALISQLSTDTALYQLRPIPYGTYRVSFTWPANAGYSASVVYTVRDVANNVLGTYTVNQTLAPSGAVDQGVPWQIGGTFTLTGLNNGLFVTQSNGGTASMVADAVRFERTSADNSIRLLDTDVVTWSAGAGWVICQAGTALAVTDAPVTNIVGGTLYQALPTSVTMGVGFNLDGASGANGSCFYNNLLNFSAIKDFPATIPGSTISYIINETPNNIGGDNRSWGNVPPGDYILDWPGASDAHIGISGGGTATETGTSNYPASGGARNRRYYTFGGDPFGYGPGISLNLSGSTIIGAGPSWNLNVGDIGLYPASVDPATAPKFRANFLARFAGMQSIRFMNSMGAIESNPTDFSDFDIPTSWLTKAAPVRTLTWAVASIQQYTGQLYNGQPYTLNTGAGVMFLITTTAAHGYAINQLVQFLNSSAYTVNLADNQGDTTTFDFDGQEGYVYPLTSTTFMWYQGPHAYINSVGNLNGHTVDNTVHPYTMTGVVSNPPTTVTMNAGTSYPIRDMVDLCNAVGAGFHANLCFSVTDACLTAFGTYMAANLNPGLKLRLACSNEVWNFGSKPNNRATAQDGNYAPFLCEMSLHQWSLIESAWVAGGRSIGDIIRVMEGQYVEGAPTATICQYMRDRTVLGVAAPGTFHEFAVAPYLGNNPSFVTGYSTQGQFSDVLDRMTAAQHMDLWEYHYTYGRYEQEMLIHRGQLDSFGFTNVKLIAYEGGPQTMHMGGGTNVNAAAIGHAMIRHPRWLGNFQNSLRPLQDSTGLGKGCTLFEDFEHSGVDGNQGNWNQWSAYSVTDQLPYVPGDPTQDAIQVNQFDRMDLVHSVTGGALRAWAAKYNATPLPPSPASTFGNSRRLRSIRVRGLV